MELESSNHKLMTVKNILIVIVIIALIILVTLYVCNEDFRQVIDTYIFRKEVTQEHSTYIELNGEDNQFVYAYDKYILTLNKGMLDAYTSSGNKAFSLEMTIGNPIFASNGRFLCVAENNGQKIYLVSGENIIWQSEIEGNISKVNVNKNGYVSAIIKGTSYKTVVVTYNSDGKELFKTYLSSTNAVATDISNDNKYLAIAEVNSSGSTIGSNIKIISVTKAESDPTNSVVYTYKAEANSLITNLKYQDKGVLVCMYNDGIHIIDNQTDEVLITTSEDTSYMDINLRNTVLVVQNKQKGILNNQTQVIIKNVHNKTENLYTLDGLINSLYVYGENIAINIGAQIHFINSSGWLLKKYTANQEITKIVLGDSIAGVVYRNRIDIISL